MLNNKILFIVEGSTDEVAFLTKLYSQFNSNQEYDIYSLGRYGSWIYCSIEDNMKEARDLVQSIKIANE